MTKKFHKIIFVYVLRSQNILVDSLASLSSAFSFPLHQDEETIVLWQLHVLATEDHWFAKITKKVKVQGEDIDRDALNTVSLFETDEEPEEELS